MPKIDFYLIQSSAATASLAFACRLIEKVYKQQHRIYVHAENEKVAHQLDELLWTYREDSFLPHHLYGEGPEPAPPIQIGFNVIPEKQRDILLNLSNTVPEFYLQFTRVLELVPHDKTAQEYARARYRHYRTAGYNITTHKLTSIEA